MLIDEVFEKAVADAMLKELEDYLKSDVLFWQAEPNRLGQRMPQLTVSGLLESLLRTEAASGDAPGSMRLELERIKRRHLARYLSRVEQEVGSRLNIWKGYLDDYARDPRDAVSYYANEVRMRLKAELLLAELEPERRGAEARARANMLDERMRAIYEVGDFVWDERLKPFLPSERYWWLYGRLRSA